MAGNNLGSSAIYPENEQIFDFWNGFPAPDDLLGLIVYAERNNKRYIGGRKVKFEGTKFTEDKKEISFVVAMGEIDPDFWSLSGNGNMYFPNCYPQDAKVILTEENSKVIIETDLWPGINDPDHLITIYTGSLEEKVYKGDWQIKGKKSGKVKEKGTFTMKEID